MNTGLKELSIQTAYQDEPELERYRLIAADGSSMRLPGSEEIISEFGHFKPNGTTGTISNLFVDLYTLLICSARLAAWEQTLAKLLLKLNQIIYL